MEENTKKLIEVFKNTDDIKKQLAYLDVLNDLLSTTRKKQAKVTTESVLLEKAVKDSDVFDLEKYKDNPEKFKLEINKFIKFLNIFFGAFRKVIGDNGVGIFSYNKPKNNFSDLLFENYGSIDKESYKDICINRQIFIKNLEIFGLLKKIDTEKKYKQIFKELEKKLTFKDSYNIENFKKELSGVIDFSSDDAKMLPLDKIKDKKIKKYFEIVTGFFPHIDFVNEANDELKKVKMDFYFYDKEKLKELDLLFSFETKLKTREEFFSYEYSILNVNGFKIHSPDINTKIDNILEIIYIGAKKDQSLDFIGIKTLRKVLTEHIEKLKFFNDKFHEDYYYSLYFNNLKKEHTKFDNDAFYESVKRLVKKYITTKQFDDSLKYLNGKIIKKIDGINKKFFRMTKDGLYIQYK